MAHPSPDLTAAAAAERDGVELTGANPSRILVDDIPGLADSADIVVVRILGGTRAWEDGLAAVAGYPHLTVPMGGVRGLPVGLSFIGPAWSEARLLALGYAFEQAAPEMKLIPTMVQTVEESPAVQALFAPAKR